MYGLTLLLLYRSSLGGLLTATGTLWQRPCLPTLQQYMEVDPTQDVYMEVVSIRQVLVAGVYRLYLQITDLPTSNVNPVFMFWDSARLTG